MKAKFLLGVVALFMVAIVFAALSFAPKAEVTKTVDATGTTEAVAFATPGTYYDKVWNLDTITNTEIDTLTLTGQLSTLVSAFQYNYAIKRTSISGTANVKVYLDESAQTTGTTNWYTIDSSSTTTATNATIRAAYLYGKRHRLRVKGTGTQLTSYLIAANYKQTN